jgi:hypothetical protein
MIGLDIAKNVFEVHGRNGAGEVVLRRTVKRSNMEKVSASFRRRRSAWRRAARRITGVAC